MEVHRYGRDVVFKIGLVAVALQACPENQIPVVVERSNRHKPSANDVFLRSRSPIESSVAVGARDVLERPAAEQRIGIGGCGQSSAF